MKTRFLILDHPKVIEAKRKEDEEEYRHIYLGDAARRPMMRFIIKRSWIRAAIRRTTRSSASSRLAASVSVSTVADSGEDKNAAVAAHGFLATMSTKWKAREDELLSRRRAFTIGPERLGRLVDYDSIGGRGICRCALPGR